MNKLLILGAGQYGMVTKEIAESIDCFSDIAFLDDNHPMAIGKLDEYEKFRSEFDSAIVAIGCTELRLELIRKLEQCGYAVPALIHSNAYVSPSAKIGKGFCIEPLVVIHTETVIGVGCLISAGTIVNHNCIIGDGCHLNCGTIVAARMLLHNQTKTDYGAIINKE